MAPPFSQDRLVRKEVALGTLREYEPPQDHMGLRLIAPFEEVQSDDVIFSYTRGLTAGLAPARAEDAESELAQKDESVGSGRASLIDWALKDHYDPSDVQRYQDALIVNGLQGADAVQLFTTSTTADFERRVARDAMIRRRKLDNRIEWLIMTALDTGSITYNDNRISFTCSYGRPGGQQDFATPTGQLWSSATADPIEDILQIQYTARDTYGVNLNRIVVSTKVIRNLRKSNKFTDALTGANPLYRVTGWGDQAALDFIEAQTGVTFIVYDSVYRTRPFGSNTTTNTKFLRDNKAIFLPSADDVASLDDTFGFGKTLTSPHPEGNWTPGYYEWERGTVDPWGRDFGSGIKAFPVLPHLDLTYVMNVLA